MGTILQETTQFKKSSNSKSIFTLAGESWASSGRMNQLPTTPNNFCPLPQALCLQRSVSHLGHFGVIRAVANGELVSSKGNRHKARRLPEHHHTKCSQGLCGKCFSHLGSVRNSATNSTTCRSMKQYLGTEFENVFPVHSFLACSCCKYM